MGGSKADGEGVSKDNGGCDFCDVVGKEGLRRDTVRAVLPCYLMLVT